MAKLTARELAEMQESAEDLLPDFCNILSVTRTDNGMGQWTEVWGTIQRHVSCRLDYNRGSLVTAGAALQPASGWVLTLPHDTVMRSTYRVEVNGQMFSITGLDPRKSWKITQRLEVQLV